MYMLLIIIRIYMYRHHIHTGKMPMFNLRLMIALQQEAILLDLLRVISHHRARLATPIRTVQKIYSEAKMEDVPFADTIFRRSGAASNRPFLLIEPSYKINGDGKVKASALTNEEKDSMEEAGSTSDSKANAKFGATSIIDPKVDKVKTSSANDSSSSSKLPVSGAQSRNPVPDDSVEVNSEKQYSESKGEPLKATSSGMVVTAETSPGSNPQSANEESEISSAASQAKQDVDRSVALPSVVMPSLEENIVLGVALEGSKLTLPIEEETTPSGAPHTESGSNLIGKDKKDGQTPLAHGGVENNN